MASMPVTVILELKFKPETVAEAGDVFRRALADTRAFPGNLGTDVLVDENDILRDQGEAYAVKLRDADVPTACVRFNGTMHDFMMLNALRETESTRAAMDLAAAAFRRAFGAASS